MSYDFISKLKISSYRFFISTIYSNIPMHGFFFNFKGICKHVLKLFLFIFNLLKQNFGSRQAFSLNSCTPIIWFFHWVLKYVKSFGLPYLLSSTISLKISSNCYKIRICFIYVDNIYFFSFLCLCFFFFFFFSLFFLRMLILLHII